ncbi:MAG: O-antigen ligase family protein [Bacilli bacterium]|nr:O-antigen ligase family protein [Bacilli bacterium]
MFINTIIGIALIQCVLSIDMVGNRYLENILKSIGSGYLDRDFNRMSGTIQYANTLAILCLISIVLLYKKISKENNIYKFILLYISTFILLSTIVLTGTRSVLILLIISFVILIFKNKKEMTKNLVIYIPIVIFTLIYSAIAYSNMMTFNIYYIFLVSLVVSAVLGFVTYKLLVLKNSIQIVSNKKVLIFTAISMVIYCILALNISKPLYLNNKDSESLIINNLQEKNEIKITVKTLEDDSRYRLVINSVDNDNVEENISSFNYSDNTSGNFKCDFNLNKEIKYVKVYVYCDKGKIKIEKIRLNDKNIKTDYVLIPRTLVYRFNDLLKGSTSSSDRITYYKDALKIICKSVPNFVIGTGGEGFNNMYKMVQTVKYTSSEVHNSFLQIFVESGILGFLVILSILIYTIFKSKNSYIKFAYIIFVIHSCIDLNFSYMFMICIFGILIACMEYTNEKKENNNIYLYIITLIMALTLTIISFIFSFKALLAQYVKIPVYNEENITLDKQIEVVCQNEKRVMLDPYEYNYRKKLNEEYERYFELLDEKIKDDKNKYILQ